MGCALEEDIVNAKVLRSCTLEHLKYFKNKRSHRSYNAESKRVAGAEVAGVGSGGPERLSSRHRVLV